MEKLYASYKDKAHIYVVYIHEALPTDGKAIKGREELQKVAREKLKFKITDPKSLEERQAVAKEMAVQFKLSLPVLVDTIDDQVDKLYAGWPERLYIIDAEGKIAHKSRQSEFIPGLKAAPELLNKLLTGKNEQQKADDSAAPKIDAAKIEALFKKLDANGDGKLSKDEFKKLAELGQGRLKDNPELIDKLLEKLDANGDGFLTLEEFKKLSELKTVGAAAADAPAPKIDADKAAGAAYKAVVGPVPFAVEEVVWQDEARQRTIKTLVYSPKEMPGPLPLVMFSPGLGGSHKEYSYLGRAWASHGYVVVTFDHPGSNEDLDSPAALGKGIKDRKNVILRVGDVRFVLNRILAGGDGHAVLKGRIDAKKIAMAGHSYGAYTATTASGLIFTYEGNAAFSMSDERFRAAIAMGTQGIEDVFFGTHERSWDKISIPFMTMTGTLDRGSRGQDYTWRNEAFAHLKPGDKYNVIIERATHLTYAGEEGDPLIPRNEPKHDPRHYSWIEMTTLAFLDAYVKDEEAAKAWLCSEMPARHTGGEMVVNRK